MSPTEKHDSLGVRLIALLDRRQWSAAARLIESGADLHYGNGYALREALLVLSAQEGRVKCLKCLLELGTWSPKGMESAVLAANRRRQGAALEAIFEDMMTRHGWPYVRDFISYELSHTLSLTALGWGFRFPAASCCCTRHENP